MKINCLKNINNMLFSSFYKKGTPNKDQYGSIHRKQFVYLWRSSLHLYIHVETLNKKHIHVKCGSTCTACSNSKRYVLTNTIDNPYSCNEKSEKHWKSLKLTTFMRTHIGEKSYFCEVCGSKFSYSQDRKILLKNH